MLLLGRFTEGRIAVLDRLREELRKRGYLPIVFNFDKPETKDFTETVRLLAGLSRFVIADVTDPQSVPAELQAAVPAAMVPFVPIITRSSSRSARATRCRLRMSRSSTQIDFCSACRMRRSATFASECPASATGSRTIL